MTQTRWLTSDEMALWTRYMRVQKQLFAALNRQLQADSGLSLTDWDVLVALSADAAHGTLAITELAATLGWERSRLSHHAARMQERGLLLRTVSPTDRRVGSYRLTDAGWAATRSAAPGHVQTVRRLFLDPLDPERIAAMTEGLQQIIEQLDAGIESGTT